MDDVKMAIMIETESDEEKWRIGTLIHEQLRGNQDYIDSNILLNMDDPDTVRLYIFKECKNVPRITI